MASMRVAHLQKNKISLQLLKNPEVIGVGVGHADPKRPSRGGAIIVYTHRNVVTADVSRALSRLMDTRMPTRIIEAGLPRPHPALMARKKRNFKGQIGIQRRRAYASQIVPQRRFRPIPGGVSIGYLVNTNSSSIGTGGLVTIRNGQLFLLTNNHVAIRDNQFAPNMYQPGPFEEGSTFNPNDVFGRAAEYVPLRANQVNFMDAAIVRGVSNTILEPRYLRPVLGTWRTIIVPGHLNSVRVGENVYKTGRTSGFGTGVVESVNVDQRVGPYPEVGGAVLLFRNQLVIRGQSIPGDSGSVWLRSGDNWAVGLNFAGGGGVAIANPIGTVMNTFGLRVALPPAHSGTVRRGAIKDNRGKGDYGYSLPLTANQRKQIQVVRRK
ncbi:hypothetical protein [Ammoniphilus resinae]|uniref:Serine protease n=1 Tax=Ammoniphilus resinae TaxID=861532 RepID=A0ABS4GQ33_9BACL|nr:hypothetical protein [Ammoniphilus resinae]MBP1932381.1 hypothetical protein [Ammoniphilus resinae]